MSWSYSATGKPQAILENARIELNRINCAEPEQTIKNKVLHILETSLLAMPENSAVRITASGSQSTAWAGAPLKEVQGKFTNSLKLEIEPIWNFVG